MTTQGGKYRDRNGIRVVRGQGVKEKVAGEIPLGKLMGILQEQREGRVEEGHVQRPRVEERGLSVEEPVARAGEAHSGEEPDLLLNFAWGGGRAPQGLFSRTVL